MSVPRSRYAYSRSRRPVRSYPARDPTRGLSGVSGAQLYISRMRKPEKKRYAQALLNSRTYGGPAPARSHQPYELEVERNLDKVLDWPSTQCHACRRRIAMKRGPLGKGSDARLCGSCDAQVPCIDCGQPRGSSRPAPPPDSRRDPRIDRRAQCASCAETDDLGTTPAPVRRARLRRRMTGLAVRTLGWAATVVLIAVVVAIARPWENDHTDVTRSGPIGGSPALGSQRTGGGSGGTGYIGGGHSGTGSGTTNGSGGTSYGPGLVPTFRCRDGSLSYAQHSQGACSHHGGIGGPATVAVPTSTYAPQGTFDPSTGDTGLDFCDDTVDVCLDQAGLDKVPRARAATEVLRNYYVALNKGDYAVAYLLLNEQRRRQITEQEWAASQVGLTYSHVHILEFRTAGSAAVVSLSYLSNLSRADTPADTCWAWTLTRDITSEGDSPRIGPPTEAKKVACSAAQETLSLQPLGP